MSINKQNKAYRKGAILGLTLAEIMLLVVFLLLLIFSVALRNERDINKLVSMNNTKYEKIVNVINEQEPDMMDELVEAVEGMPFITQLIKKDDLKKAKEESMSHVIIRGLEKLKDEKQIKDTSKAVDIQTQLQQVMTDREQLTRELKDQKNQNLNLINKLHKEGTGFDLPPCWPDSKGKASEYIFNVYLYSDGKIQIHDNKLPNRISDQSKLPISMISYDAKLDIMDFRKQTTPIYNWSKKNNCRFYVGIHDRTTNNEKVLYKKLKNVVEDVFYKYEYRN